MTWKTCKIHGDDKPNAWGCPECLRELRLENRKLKRALAFWLPHVPDEDTARGDRIAADAYLLCGYEGPDEVDAETVGWIVLTSNVVVQGQDEAQLRTVPLERPVGREEE